KRILELGEARVGLGGVRSEHLVICDAPAPEPREGGQHRAARTRVRDARDASGPTIAHALLRRAGELVRRGGVLERANRANPAGKPALGVPPGEMGELEVGMTVD